MAYGEQDIGMWYYITIISIKGAALIRAVRVAALVAKGADPGVVRAFAYPGRETGWRGPQQVASGLPAGIDPLCSRMLILSLYCGFKRRNMTG